MTRRVGCLILALLFALIFIFWGMMCRLTLPISPAPAASHGITAPEPVRPIIPANPGSAGSGLNAPAPEPVAFADVSLRAYYSPVYFRESIQGLEASYDAVRHAQRYPRIRTVRLD